MYSSEQIAKKPVEPPAMQPYYEWSTDPVPITFSVTPVSTDAYTISTTFQNYTIPISDLTSSYDIGSISTATTYPDLSSLIKKPIEIKIVDTPNDSDPYGILDKSVFVLDVYGNWIYAGTEIDIKWEND